MRTEGRWGSVLAKRSTMIVAPSLCDFWPLLMEKKIKITFNSYSFNFKIHLKLFKFVCVKSMYSNVIDLKGGASMYCALDAPSSQYASGSVTDCTHF